MQLWLTIGVLAAIVSGEFAQHGPANFASLRVFLVMLAVAVVSFTAKAIAQRSIRLWQSHNCERSEWLRRLDRAQKFHAGLWLLSSFAILYGLAWPQIIRENSGLGAWPLVDDVLILLPVVLPLGLSWMAFHRIDVALAAAGAIDSKLAGSAFRYVLWQFRQQLAPLLVPALALLGVEDLIRLFAPRWLEGEQHWTWGLPILALMLLGFPLLIRRLWKTEPLPSSPVREQIESAISVQNLPVRNILVWHTGGRMVNAAVSGFFPRLRYLFLTDALLERFSTEQIAGVVAHELGHVRGRHLLLRVLAIAAPVLFLLAIGRLVPDESLAGEPSLGQAGFDLTASSLVLPVGLFIYAATVLGRFSRSLEFEADYLACCPADGTSEPEEPVSGRMSIAQTERFLSTLAHLAAAGENSPDQVTWLHPSLIQRARLLLTMLHHPPTQLRFAKRMRQQRLLLFAACGLGLLLQFC